MLRRLASIALAALLGAATLPASAEPNNLATAVRAAADASAPTIVGGRPSVQGRWPFVVALLRSDEPDNFQAQFCGGTLISKRVILTAAHCTEGQVASGIDVGVGNIILTKISRRIPVAKIINHPRYNPDTVDFDVALLVLSEPVTDIKPVGLLSLGQERTLGAVGKPAITVGWGLLRTDGAAPNRQREVQVSLMDFEFCNGPDSYNGELTSRMICAGTKRGGKDSCQGDSGGPLFVKNSAGKYLLQAGVVSFGGVCGAAATPGIYSRVALLRPWILRHVNANR